LGPGSLGLLTVIFVIGITVYVALEQQKLAFKEDREKLVVEAAHAKDHFRDILYSDITVANSMAVIYREYGFKNNFDSVAQALLSKSEYAQVVQLTINGIISNVYPIAGYEATIGLDLRKDSLRGPEYERAVQKREIFFAGPRPLRGGGTGILGKVPVVIGDSANALIVVLTKIELIQKSMMGSDTSYKNFSYELIKKTPGTDSSHYYISTALPSLRSPSVTSDIPEGDWILSVSYADGYTPPPIPISILLAGIAVALIAFIMVFRISSQNTLLAKTVNEKTHDLRERIKELSTIYRVNTMLQDEHIEIGLLLQNLVDIIPSGWQHSESCAAKISFDGVELNSSRYVNGSAISFRAPFKTIEQKEGYIEVIYTDNHTDHPGEPFLQEERDLLNTLAEQLKTYLDKRYTKEQNQRTEAKFRAGFEHAAIGMALVSLTNRWVSVNHALCEMIGYKAEELIGRTVSDITYPEDREADALNVLRALSGEIDYYRKEKRYVHKNGSIVWIKLNVALIRDEGEPLYFVGQIENISEKLESEMKFRNLVEKSMVGVYIIQNGRFAYINPRIIEQSGYSETELANMRVEQFVHPEDVARVTENIRSRISGEIQGIRYDVRAFAKDGSMMWLEMFGNTTLYHGKPAIIGTMVNITDKKNAFNELVKSEANLKTIFDTSKIAYMLLDDQLNILTVNQYFQDSYFVQTGMRLEIGGNFVDTVLPARRKIIAEMCSTALTTGKIISAETSYPNKDGSTNYFEFSYSPVITDGKVIGLCYTGLEVTSRKRSELERQKLLEERLDIIEDLTKRNRDLEQFSYIVSHNVRGPVATILGLSSMAKNPDFDPQVQQTAIDGIIKSTSNLDSVLLDLNEILSLRKNNQEKRTDVRLDEVAQTAVEMTTAIAERFKPIITFDFSAAPFVYGIKSYLQNIFYNMISNAIKYAKPNTEPELKVWSELTDTHVILYFKDRGSGIDLEKYGEYIFGLYKRFQLAGNGKGMGLFMVKTQVEALEGTISVNSTPGEGAEFILTFKRKPSEEEGL
jgi:PAS domain S-box-containing protein